MENPAWPTVSVNYRGVTGGVECTMKTRLDIDMAVSVIRADANLAEKVAKRLLTEKVKDREALIRRKS